MIDCNHDRVNNICINCGDDDTAYCVNGCGREAIEESFSGIVMKSADDFEPVYDLVCSQSCTVDSILPEC